MHLQQANLIMNSNIGQRISRMLGNDFSIFMFTETFSPNFIAIWNSWKLLVVPMLDVMKTIQKQNFGFHGILWPVLDMHLWTHQLGKEHPIRLTTEIR